MTAGITAPNVANYLIGKGVILLKPVGDSVFYPVGNVPTLEITPTVDKLDHFSSMEGTKTKDDTVVLTKSGTIRMVMEEITAKNIALLMLGDVTTDVYGLPTINLFSRSSLESAFRFYGTNDKGPRWFIDLPRVIWNPSGAFSPVSDAYATLEATGEWAASAGVFGTMSLLAEAGTEAPQNVLAPSISPSVLHSGTVATVSRGAWIGASSYTYQWKKATVAISGATSQTYTIVVGDVGSSITCTVTATNTVGSTSATTAGITPT